MKAKCDRRVFLAGLLGLAVAPLLPKLPSLAAPTAEVMTGPGGPVWKTITLTARELHFLTRVPNELLCEVLCEGEGTGIQ
jgi:hypothetical protein